MDLTQLSLPYAHLGVLLQLLREDRQMSLLTLVAALERHGYAMSPATYIKMEAGILVSDGEAFLAAYTKTMQLSDRDSAFVVAQWGYDLWKRFLGEDLARLVFALLLPTNVATR